MSVEQPEGKPPSEPIRLRLEERVYPFKDGPHLEFELGSGTSLRPSYFSRMILETPTVNGLKDIGLKARLETTFMDGLEIIPFHPKEGYVITSEDLNLDARRKKLFNHVASPKSRRDSNLNPSYWKMLDVDLDLEFFAKHNYFMGGDVVPEVQQILDQLLCVVTAGGNYMSYGADSGDDPSGFYFNDFFPFDTGPLPRDHEQYNYGCTYYFDMTMEGDEELNLENVTMGRGHRLYFSSNPAERAQIEISFVLAPQVFNPGTLAFLSLEDLKK